MYRLRCRYAPNGRHPAAAYANSARPAADAPVAAPLAPTQLPLTLGSLRMQAIIGHKSGVIRRMSPKQASNTRDKRQDKAYMGSRMLVLRRRGQRREMVGSRSSAMAREGGHQNLDDLVEGVCTVSDAQD